MKQPDGQLVRGEEPSLLGLVATTAQKKTKQEVHIVLTSSTAEVERRLPEASNRSLRKKKKKTRKKNKEKVRLGSAKK